MHAGTHAIDSGKGVTALGLCCSIEHVRDVCLRGAPMCGLCVDWVVCGDVCRESDRLAVDTKVRKH